MKQTNKEPKRGSLLEMFSDQFSRVPTNNNNKQVGVRLGLECHLIFNLLLLLSGVHGVIGHILSRVHDMIVWFLSVVHSVLDCFLFGHMMS